MWLIAYIKACVGIPSYVPNVPVKEKQNKTGCEVQYIVFLEKIKEEYNM